MSLHEYEFQRFTRRCAKTGCELKPGDNFYSALIPEGANLVRRDFAQQAWEGPPEGTIGWWKAKVPEPDASKVNWAPNDVMLHYFVELEGREDAVDTRFVLALLMIRRRIVRLEETQRDSLGRQWLVLYCPRNELEYRVLVVSPTHERITVVQTELANLLFAGAA